VSLTRTLFAPTVAMWRRHKDLLSNAVSLLAATGITSGLGFIFWTLAAREFSQEAVGYGSATVSAMTLLATVGVFGLGTILIGELPRRKFRAELISAALITSGVGSVLLALGFVGVAPIASKRFGYILDRPAEVFIFGVGVTLTAVSSVFDDATIGLLRGGVQLSRNFTFAIVKMLTLPLAAVMLNDKFGLGISTSWVIGIVVSLFGSALWLRIRGSPVMPRPDWAVLRALGKTALAHNWLNLAIAVPVTLMPVIVTIVVSPSANAAFYVAWMLTGFLYAVPSALSPVLFAVASAEPHIIARKLRFALKVSLSIGIPAMLALFFGAHFALSLFGPNYAREATFPLRLLSITYLPTLPKIFYIAVCRAAGRISRAAVVLTAFAIAEITAASVSGSIGGLNGLSIAILSVTLIEGLATTPAILRTIYGHGRHRRSGAISSGEGINSRVGAYSNRRQHNSARSYSKVQPSFTSTEASCLYRQGTDSSGHADSFPRDQQAAGIAALLWIAKCTAPTTPLPIAPTAGRYSFELGRLANDAILTRQNPTRSDRGRQSNNSSHRV
jgi:O-antigen/teichoic acid export membrane protein